jgi:hypothetical protein
VAVASREALNEKCPAILFANHAPLPPLTTGPWLSSNVKLTALPLARIFHTQVAQMRRISREERGARRTHIRQRSVTDEQQSYSLEEQADGVLGCEIFGLV